MSRGEYHEGDWFGVPLADGFFAVGLVARANRDGVLLGYFFGPRRAHLPSLQDLAHLEAGGAVLVGKFGHLGLRRGKWPLLGRLKNWDRGQWPMPTFKRYEELTGRTFKVTYAEDDPNELVQEDLMPASEARTTPTDGLMGSGYVEEVLNSLVALDA